MSKHIFDFKPDQEKKTDQREEKLQHLAQCESCADLYLSLAKTVEDEYIDPEFLATAECTIAMKREDVPSDDGTGIEDGIPVATGDDLPEVTELKDDKGIFALHSYPIDAGEKFFIKLFTQEHSPEFNEKMIRLTDRSGEKILLEQKVIDGEISGIYSGKLDEVATPFLIKLQDNEFSEIAVERLYAQRAPTPSLGKSFALFLRDNNEGEILEITVDIARNRNGADKPPLSLDISPEWDRDFRDSLQITIWELQKFIQTKLNLPLQHSILVQFISNQSNRNRNLRLNDSCAALPTSLAILKALLIIFFKKHFLEDTSLQVNFAATGVLERDPLQEGNSKICRVNGINEKLKAAIPSLNNGDYFLYPSDNKISPQISQEAVNKGINLCPVNTLDQAIEELFPFILIEEGVPKQDITVLSPIQVKSISTAKSPRILSKFFHLTRYAAAFILVFLIMFFIPVKHCPTIELELNKREEKDFKGMLVRECEYTGALNPHYLMHVIESARMNLKKDDEVKIEIEKSVNYKDIKEDFEADKTEIIGSGKRGVWVLLTSKETSEINPEQARPYQKELSLRVEGSSGERLVFFTPEGKLTSNRNLLWEIGHWFGIVRDEYEDNFGSFLIKIKVIHSICEINFFNEIIPSTPEANSLTITLKWKAQGKRAQIIPLGEVPLEGERTLTINESNTYKLVVYGEKGNFTEKSIDVEDKRPKRIPVYTDSYNRWTNPYYMPTGDGISGPNTNCVENPKFGKKCMEIGFQEVHGIGRGLYLTTPPVSGNPLPNLFNLLGIKKGDRVYLSFWARGKAGGEVIEVKCGGYQSGGVLDSLRFPVSAQDEEGSFFLTLSTTWKHFQIDLTGKDISKMPSSICVWAYGDRNNPEVWVYLDEIYFQTP